MKLLLRFHGGKAQFVADIPNINSVPTNMLIVIKVLEDKSEDKKENVNVP